MNPAAPPPPSAARRYPPPAARYIGACARASEVEKRYFQVLEVACYPTEAERISWYLGCRSLEPRLHWRPQLRVHGKQN